MQTPKSESEIATAITDYVTQHHPNLMIYWPSSSGQWTFKGYSLPSPDLVISNPNTGDSIGIEVYSTPKSQDLPFGLYPRWKSMHNAYKAANTDLYCVTTSSMSEGFSSNVATSGINVYQWDNAHVLPALESKLRKLESPSR